MTQDSMGDAASLPEEQETASSPERETVPSPGYVKPPPARAKAALFNVVVFLAALVNLAGAVLSYSILSEGEILGEFYSRLAAADLSFFVWVAAGIALAAGIGTALAYILSLDFRRLRRPAKRLHLLFTTFLVFLAGAGLGILDVSADTVWAFLMAGVGALLLPLLVPLLERALGVAFSRSADRLLRGNSPVAARGTARASLRFRPADPHTEQTYGLAMARSGRSAAALPYLLAHPAEIGSQPAPVASALADVYEANGEDAHAVTALETLYAQEPTPQVFARLVKQWLGVGRRDEVLRELQALPPEQRREWHDTLQELVFERGDVESQRAFCREIELGEGPPFTRAHRCYAQLLEIHPHDIPAHRSLMELARRRGDTDHAAQLLEGLIELDDTNSTEDRRTLVSYYWTKGDRAGMLRHLTRIHLAGQATLDEKLRIVDEHFAEGDYASVEALIYGDEELASSPRALTTLAHSLWEGNRLEDSVEVIKRARERQPEPELAKSLEALEKSIRAKSLAQGLEDLRRQVKENPDDLDLRFEYYDKLVPSGKVDRVVIELEDLLTKHPEHRPRVEREIRWLLTRHGRNFRLLDYLGDLYMRDRDFDRAFELYEERVQGDIHADSLLHESSRKVLERAPEHKPALLAEVSYLFKQGQHAEALHFLDRYYTAGGDANVGLQQLEFSAAHGMGDLARAEAVGKAILEQHPDDTSFLTQMASLATQLRHYDEAATYLKRAQELDPENHLFRRQAKDSEEKRKRARIEEIRTLVSSGKADHALHEELGDLYHDFGQLNEAMTEYQRSSHGAPDRRVAKAKLGFVLSRKGMHQESDETLQETELRPDMPAEELTTLKALFYSAAELMEEDGEDERALGTFRRVFRVDAGYKDVVGHVERLQRTDKNKKKKRD